MPPELPAFAARLRENIDNAERGVRNAEHPAAAEHAREFSENEFNRLALELFALQFAHNAPYQRVCEVRHTTPETARHWTEIPAVPTSAFKEFDLTCLPPAKRTHVFHSSGTTGQCPSRHFHCAESLAVYETSLWAGFARHVVPDFKFGISNFKFALLTPPLAQAPHSSLVHMFDTVRRRQGAAESAFLGRAAEGGGWAVDFAQTLARLRAASADNTPLVLLGTAFSFVHLLDSLAEQDLIFKLPSGSRVMETGGYKGRARTLTQAELHALITDRLGIPLSHIVCEYGMSELSSQAYDAEVRNAECGMRNEPRVFKFPPWARVQIISPETGREAAEGETGLIRVFDLANVWSVLAIQTEDLGVRRGDGFELVGRAVSAEPRGCSLLAVDALNPEPLNWKKAGS